MTMETMEGSTAQLLSSVDDVDCLQLDDDDDQPIIPVKASRSDATKLLPDSSTANPESNASLRLSSEPPECKRLRMDTSSRSSAPSTVQLHSSTGVSSNSCPTSLATGLLAVLSDGKSSATSHHSFGRARIAKPGSAFDQSVHSVGSSPTLRVSNEGSIVGTESSKEKEPTRPAAHSGVSVHQSHISRGTRIPGPAGSLRNSNRRAKRPVDETSESAVLISSRLARRSCSGRPVEEDQSFEIGTPSSQELMDFSHGPWITMLRCMSLPPFGQENLRHNIAWILRGGFWTKVPSLIVMIAQLVFCDTNIKVLLKDPTGSMECTMLRSVGDNHPDLKRGAVLVLQKVSVFTPAPNVHSLNIVDTNISRIFPSVTNDSLADDELWSSSNPSQIYATDPLPIPPQGISSDTSTGSSMIGPRQVPGKFSSSRTAVYRRGPGLTSPATSDFRHSTSSTNVSRTMPKCTVAPTHPSHAISTRHGPSTVVRPHPVSNQRAAQSSLGLSSTPQPQAVTSCSSNSLPSESLFADDDAEFEAQLAQLPY